jgi:hypothetical protein
MNYIVAYTLKHRTEPDTFEDYWMIYKEGELPNPKQSAIDYYNDIIEQDGGEQWYVWTACVSVVIESTDLFND